MFPLWLSSRRVHLILLGLLYLLLASGIALWGRTHGYAFQQVNPAYQIMEAAKSLWQSGNLERSELRGIYNLQLEKSRRDPKTIYWQDIFSLGKDGQLYPIRAIFLTYVAAPFYGILGDLGFWIFEQVLILLILLSFYWLCSTLTSPATGMLMSLALLIGTSILRYAYTVSYDIFATCLIIVGLLLLRSYPFWGALILTASIETRPTNFLYVVFLLFAWLPYYSRKKHAVVSILGGALLSALGIMLLNYALWGDPLVTGFNRKLAFVHGAAVIEHPAFDMEFRILVSHWGEKLMGPAGLFRSSPIILAFPFAVVCAFSSRFRFFYLIAAAAALTHILMIYSLPTWEHLDNASRYLMSSIILIVLISAELAERFRVRMESQAAP